MTVHPVDHHQQLTRLRQGACASKQHSNIASSVIHKFQIMFLAEFKNFVHLNCFLRNLLFFYYFYYFSPLSNIFSYSPLLDLFILFVSNPFSLYLYSSHFSHNLPSLLLHSLRPLKRTHAGQLELEMHEKEVESVS